MTIPNDGDTNYIDTEYESRPMQADWDILEAGVNGLNGVVSGLVVSQHTSPAMSVDITSGSAAFSGVLVVVTGGTINIATAHATLPRLDLIVALDDGTVDVFTGTPATAPFMPTIAAGTVGLAQVYVPPLAASIHNNNIVRKSVTVRDPTQINAGWTTIEATADLGRTSTATIAADPVLKFTMAANEKYRIRLNAFFRLSVVTIGNYPKIGLSGPASPDLYMGTVTLATPGVSTSTSTTFAGNTTIFARALSLYDAVGGSASFLPAVNYWAPVFFDAIVHNGSNSGDLALWWSQYTADTQTITRMAGSYLEYAEVA